MPSGASSTPTTRSTRTSSSADWNSSTPTRTRVRLRPVRVRRRRRPAGPRGQADGRGSERRGQPLARLLHENVVPNLTALARMGSIEEPTRLRYDESLVYGDWDFWIRLLARGRARFLPRVLGRSRITGTNVSIGIARTSTAATGSPSSSGCTRTSRRSAARSRPRRCGCASSSSLPTTTTPWAPRAAPPRSCASALARDPDEVAYPGLIVSWVLGTRGWPGPRLLEPQSHLAAAGWLRTGAVGAPPAEARPDLDFAAWVVPRACLPARERLGPARRQSAGPGRLRRRRPRRAGLTRRLVVRCLVRGPISSAGRTSNASG